ncbi:MAG: cache domain-containing protein [Chlamydiota bacterium]
MNILFSNFRKILYVTLSSFMLQAVSGCSTNNKTTDTSEASIQAEELITFIQEAANLIETEGEEAFSQFNEQGSKWFHGDTYIYVWNLDEDERVVFPPNHNLLGDKVSTLVDSQGRPIGQLFIEKVKSADHRGWVHYHYAKPHQEGERTVWKTSYVMRAIAPSGTTYLVGSGVYNMPPNKINVKALVDNAVSLIKAESIDAFPSLRNPESEYNFEGIYVFVTAFDGTELVNPAFPELEGRNLLELTGPHGGHPVKVMIDKLQNKNAIWLEGYWQKPGETTFSKKISYIRKVRLPNGQKIAVGAGYFPPNNEDPSM